MIPLASKHGASVYHADWRDLLRVVPECNAVIVDAPYSARTHAGHNQGPEGRRIDCAGRAINYAAWDAETVYSFVSSWSPVTLGWFVTITDHALAPVWESALGEAGRYVFSPLAFMAPGSRVRLAGDGPAQWATWIIVARPRSRAFASWGALPGGYALPPGHSERMAVVGGKPLWLMERLIEDYTRPGDTVVDPCCGAGTTLVAAQRLGRLAIGGDIKAEHAEIAARRISAGVQTTILAGEPREAEQVEIFSEETAKG